MIFVTSWDDGHPLDLKLAELLDRYNLSGTFYIPIRNSEGPAVMGKRDIRVLDSNFDIGSHTYDHIYLDKLSSTECKQQISLGKSVLEDYLGHSVDGFCYPGGKYNKKIVETVQDLNIKHARTINNFSLDAKGGKLLIPTTLQFYPHKKPVYYSNYLKQKKYFNRYPAFKPMVFGRDWLNALYCLFEKHQNSDKIFHVWGHSWEIDELNLWAKLEDFFKFASSFNTHTSTVSELFKNKNL